MIDINTTFPVSFDHHKGFSFSVNWIGQPWLVEGGGFYQLGVGRSPAERRSQKLNPMKFMHLHHHHHLTSVGKMKLPDSGFFPFSLFTNWLTEERERKLNYLRRKNGLLQSNTCCDRPIAQSGRWTPIKNLRHPTRNCTSLNKCFPFPLAKGQDPINRLDSTQQRGIPLIKPPWA